MHDTIETHFHLIERYWFLSHSRRACADPESCVRGGSNFFSHSRRASAVPESCVRGGPTFFFFFVT